MASIILPDDPTRPEWAMTLGEFLDKTVSRNPAKTYLYFRDRRISFQEFRDRSLKAAALFRDLGISRGDRVGLFLPNCPEFLYAWLGLSRLGAVGVPINTAYKEDEGCVILNDAGPKILVAHQTTWKVAQGMLQRLPTVEKALVVHERAGETRGVWDFNRELEKSMPLTQSNAVTPQDISMLGYTSGSTGKPKGVMISHAMYVAAGQGFATWVAARPDDRFFTCLPLHHANAQYYSTMGSLAAGASLILEEHFSASRFWDQLNRSGATVVNFIGMMLPVLMKQPPAESVLANPPRVFYGSPAFAPEALAKFEATFGTKVIIGYGLTETCYGTIERLGHERRPRSSGLPRQHPDPRFKNEVAIVDDGDHPVSPGETGEIVLRNPGLTSGYWQDPEQTAAALRGGWFHTGDLGWLDDDGYLYFLDRKKDVIRRRGENISSWEVEEVLKREPRIMDCAVVGVPSELGEEEVKAYVVIREGEAMDPREVVDWCAEALAAFKVPRYVEFRSELPKTPSLRVRKDLLRRESGGPGTVCFDREGAEVRS